MLSSSENSQSTLMMHLNSVEATDMKKIFKLHAMTMIVSLTVAQAVNTNRNFALRFTGPSIQDQTKMTRYYRKQPQLIDLWKNDQIQAKRKHNFKRWQYEAPPFVKANMKCDGEIPRKWEVHGGAPRWGYAQWKYACGYRNPPEYVQRYYEYAKPWSRRRAEHKRRYKRFPQQIFVEERYNY